MAAIVISIWMLYKLYCAMLKQRQYNPVTTIDEQGIKVTVYDPGYAIGKTPMKSAQASNKIQGY